MSYPGLSDTVNSAVRSFRYALPQCVGAGIVDISSGLLLAVDTSDNHPRVVLDMLAAATYDIFQGPTVVTIEEMFKRHRGVLSGMHYFQDILINSENLTHLFMRARSRPDIVVAIVCDKSVNIGVLLTKARQTMQQFEAKLAA